jgi:hypothetical protein
MLSQPQIATSLQSAMLNSTALPLSLQMELLDFYEFLLKKHNLISEIKTSATKNRFKNFLANPIQVSVLQTWTREELHDR